MTPEDCFKIPVLYQSHRPYNINGTKLTGSGTDKANNRDRKTDHPIFKLQHVTSRCSNIIQNNQNDSP